MVDWLWIKAHQKPSTRSCRLGKAEMISHDETPPSSHFEQSASPQPLCLLEVGAKGPEAPPDKDYCRL